MVVTVIITSFYSKYGKIWDFYPKNTPKLVKTAIFGQKLSFLPENDVYTQASSMEFTKTPFYQFSEIFYSIPLLHLVN